VYQSVVGVAIKVDITARDAYGNLAISENRDVTFIQTGNKIVNVTADLINGLATVSSMTTMSESVQLSLTDSFGSGLDVSSTKNLTFIPDVTTRYIFLETITTSVDNSMTVTLHALDQYNNIAAAEQLDAVVLSTGSVSGEGVVNIQNGIGSIQIRNTIPENTILSLQADANRPSVAFVSTISAHWIPGFLNDVFFNV
jgi:hypothetical protein